MATTPSPIAPSSLPLPSVEGGYQLVMADPPWTFRTWSDKGKGRSPEQHYSCMTLQEIAALPVAERSAPDAILMLWATLPMMPQALGVLESWGYSYRTTGFVWIKENEGRLAMGTGYYTRANAEICLLGRRGKGLPVLDRGVLNVIKAPRRRHSQKPDEQYRQLDRLFGTGIRRLEMFARPPHAPGWHVWGLQA